MSSERYGNPAVFLPFLRRLDTDTVIPVSEPTSLSDWSTLKHILKLRKQEALYLNKVPHDEDWVLRHSLAGRTFEDAVHALLQRAFHPQLKLLSGEDSLMFMKWLDPAVQIHRRPLGHTSLRERYTPDALIFEPEGSIVGMVEITSTGSPKLLKKKKTRARRGLRELQEHYPHVFAETQLAFVLPAQSNPTQSHHSTATVEQRLFQTVTPVEIIEQLTHPTSAGLEPEKTLLLHVPLTRQDLGMLVDRIDPNAAHASPTPPTTSTASAS